MTAIEVNGVSFSYGKKKKVVLDGVTFSCVEGSVNALIGLNGCGKTTLLKVMAGLEKPVSGTVKYGDEELNEVRSYRDRSKIFAYVQQNISPTGDYTVLEYLLFGTSNQLDFCDTPKKEQIQKAKSQAERFGISDLLPCKLGELSGGQRQIVSVCSAMLQESEAILLDEPLSALDKVNQLRVLNALRDVAEEGGRTIILTTHDPNHALFLDANVFLLNGGKIIDSGMAKEVIVPRRLKPIYGDNICYSRELGYDEVSFRS